MEKSFFTIGAMNNSKPYVFGKPTKLDKSDWMLIASNIFTIIIAVIQKWDLLTIMWVYLLQSITIGFFHFLKLLNLNIPSAPKSNFSQNQIKYPSPIVKYFYAFFFLFHYGVFHLSYLIFLIAMSLGGLANHQSSSINISGIIIISITFFLNHLYSYMQNNKNDIANLAEIKTIMFQPYIRIIPMHLTLIFGGLIFNSISLALFLLLKTYVDLIMHQREHSLL